MTKDQQKVGNGVDWDKMPVRQGLDWSLKYWEGGMFWWYVRLVDLKDYEGELMGEKSEIHWTKRV